MRRRHHRRQHLDAAAEEERDHVRVERRGAARQFSRPADGAGPIEEHDGPRRADRAGPGRHFRGQVRSFQGCHPDRRRGDAQACRFAEALQPAARAVRCAALEAGRRGPSRWARWTRSASRDSSAPTRKCCARWSRPSPASRWTKRSSATTCAASTAAKTSRASATASAATPARARSSSSRRRNPGDRTICASGSGSPATSRATNQFNALVEYRKTWLNRLGGEWTTQAQIGQNTYLSTEFYQPVEASGRWFVSPYASIGQQTRGVFAGDDKVADYLVKAAQVGIAGGAVLGTWGQFGIGPVWSHIKAEIDTGSQALPEGSENTSGIPGTAVRGPDGSRLLAEEWHRSDGLRLRGAGCVRVGANLPAARGQRPVGPELGRAHGPGRACRGHRSRLGHARLRIT